MNIVIKCPTCNLTREVDDSRIPDVGTNATCPQCSCIFRVHKRSQIDPLGSKTSKSIESPRRQLNTLVVLMFSAVIITVVLFFYINKKADKPLPVTSSINAVAQSAIVPEIELYEASKQWLMVKENLFSPTVIIKFKSNSNTPIDVILVKAVWAEDSQQVCSASKYISLEPKLVSEPVTLSPDGGFGGDETMKTIILSAASASSHGQSASSALDTYFDAYVNGLNKNLTLRLSYEYKGATTVLYDGRFDAGRTARPLI